jgi:hypothetical protein
MFRFAPPFALCFIACAAPDTTLGSYDFTITSGTDTNTAPNTASTTPMGLGTLAVTPCRLNATKGTQPGTLSITAGQTCTFSYTFGSVTATMTTGTGTIKEPTMTLDLTYSYAGNIVGINYAGMGKRTYSGPRL